MLSVQHVLGQVKGRTHDPSWDRSERLCTRSFGEHKASTGTTLSHFLIRRLSWPLDSHFFTSAASSCLPHRRADRVRSPRC